ncbi:hypothetical protein DL764_006148 [Monosporascus ibericus]|uniref:Transmembrane protein n=1 Tax=Monosporascus ibericus TaxID=155417 RepID=A0A4Q4T5M4_9PEZI|nr:hypothetical protein DL764_006148 [Monosporascus ibericus]
MQQTTESKVPGGGPKPPFPTFDEEEGYEPLPVIPVRGGGESHSHAESMPSNTAPVSQLGGRQQTDSRRASSCCQDLRDWHRESWDIGNYQDGQTNSNHPDIHHRRHNNVHNYSYPEGTRQRHRTVDTEAPVAAGPVAGLAVLDQPAQDGQRTNNDLAAAPARPALPEQHLYQEQGCCNMIKDAIGSREKCHRSSSPPSPSPAPAAADIPSHTDSNHDRYLGAGPGVPLPLAPIDDLLQLRVASPPSTGRRKLFSSRKVLFAPVTPAIMRPPSSWSGRGDDGKPSFDSSRGGRGGARDPERERAAEGKKWWRWKGTEGASSGACANGNEEVKGLDSVSLSAWNNAGAGTARDAMELSPTQKAEVSRKLRSLPYITFAVIILISLVTIIGGYGSIFGQMNRHASYGSTLSPSATHGDQIVNGSVSVTSVSFSSSAGAKQSSKSETDEAQASTELLTFVGTTSLPEDPQHTYCDVGSTTTEDESTTPSPPRRTKGYDGFQPAATAELVAGRARNAPKMPVLFSTVTVTETLVASSADDTSSSAETKSASCSGSDCESSPASVIASDYQSGVSSSTCHTELSAPGVMPNTTTSGTAPSETAPGISYCSFTGRPDIYTLCAPDQTSSSNAASETSSSASGMMAGNTFGKLKRLWNFRRAAHSASPWSIRAAAASLWNSVLALGGDVGRVGTANLRWDRGRVVVAVTETEEAYREGMGGETGNCNCTNPAEIADLRNRLDFALDIVRSQQQLLDSQHAMIAQHKESLEGAMKLLGELRRERGHERRLFT